MENVKFTKGPWHLHDMEHATVVGPDHIAIALCEANSRGDEENMANATLIAAAPDLLEACKAALSDFEELVNKSLVPIAKVHPFTRTPDMLRAAITKAGGNHE